MRQFDVTLEYLREQGLSPTFPERFWAKVNKCGPTPAHRPELGPCWIWTASLFDDGYGQVRPGFSRNCIRAHRASYLLCRGPIEEGLWVLHKCDNPICVNPNHLWLGTVQENIADCSAKGRRARWRRGGERMPQHKLTDKLAAMARAQWETGLWTQRELAKFYRVSHTAMRFCLIGKTWKPTSHGEWEQHVAARRAS